MTIRVGILSSGGGHELSRCRLVAGGKADHAVEESAFDHHFDVIHDQIATGQDVAAAMTGAGNEVARGGRAHLEGKAAGGADGFFNLGSDAIEMAEADCQIGGRVDHCDLWLFHIGISDAERLPLCPAHRPAGCAALKIASQVSHHVQPQLRHVPSCSSYHRIYQSDQKCRTVPTACRYRATTKRRTMQQRSRLSAATNSRRRFIVISSSVLRPTHISLLRPLLSSTPFMCRLGYAPGPPGS